MFEEIVCFPGKLIFQGKNRENVSRSELFNRVKTSYRFMDCDLYRKGMHGLISRFRIQANCLFSRKVNFSGEKIGRMFLGGPSCLTESTRINVLWIVICIEKECMN